MSRFHSGLEKSRIVEILKRRGAKIYFVGAGGFGMYSLVRLSGRLGYTVSGSDRENSELTSELIRLGFGITVGHNPSAAVDCDLVVYTLAASDDDPEISSAERAGIACISRAEYLGALMEKYKVRIGVSGSHGKSTSVAMLDAVLCKAGLLPTTLIGANLPRSGTPLGEGGEDYLIYEACEYKDSFLRFSPTAALFTNLELDHVDYFKNIEALEDSFLTAINSARLSVVNADDERLLALSRRAKRRTVTYGESSSADYNGIISAAGGGKYSLEIRHGGESVLKIPLSVAGRFNATNALGVAAMAFELGLCGEDIKAALGGFLGIGRRLERVGELRGIPVYYDYAHHPTEISCTVRTVRELCGGRVAVIFKPHTYSRTAELMSDFATALSLADEVLLCNISAIREEAIEGVSSERLAALIEGARVVDEENIAEELSGLRSSALIIMGAADLSSVKRQILGK